MVWGAGFITGGYTKKNSTQTWDRTTKDYVERLRPEADEHQVGTPLGSYNLIGGNMTYFLRRSERVVNIILKPVLARCLQRFEAHSLDRFLRSNFSNLQTVFPEAYKVWAR